MQREKDKDWGRKGGILGNKKGEVFREGIEHLGRASAALEGNLIVGRIFGIGKCSGIRIRIRRRKGGILGDKKGEVFWEGI